MMRMEEKAGTHHDDWPFEELMVYSFELYDRKHH
jgi:hypothetical protein